MPSVVAALTATRNTYPPSRCCVQHVAAAAGFNKICQNLLDAKARKDAKTTDGHTAASLAATPALRTALE